MKPLCSQASRAFLHEPRCQSPHCGPPGSALPRPICQLPLPSPPSLPVAHSLQPHWPPRCSSNTPTTLQPQGLCSCCSSTWNTSPHRPHLPRDPPLLQVSTQTSPPRRSPPSSSCLMQHQPSVSIMGALFFPSVFISRLHIFPFPASARVSLVRT